jgi:hypothetical protein
MARNDFIAISNQQALVRKKQAELKEMPMPLTEAALAKIPLFAEAYRRAQREEAAMTESERAEITALCRQFEIAMSRAESGPDFLAITRDIARS